MTTRSLEAERDILAKQARKTLERARKTNRGGSSVDALVLADQALEILLRCTCLRSGCDSETTFVTEKKADKKFSSWGMTEYVVWLQKKNMLTKDEVANFFTFHDWRNKAQHSGIEPSSEQVEDVISFIEHSLQRLKELWDQEVSYPTVTIDYSQISEDRDVHPIFRENPFLVLEGSEFVRGEKHLEDSLLKRIDIHLIDQNRVPTFVEVEWNAVHVNQAHDYLRILKGKDQPFRLIWLVPSDLKTDLPKEIEVVPFDRKDVAKLVETRTEARKVIEAILDILSKPFTPFKTYMHQMEYHFPNVISACYFDAEMQADKDKKIKLGLRKQSVGRYLDLVKSVCHSEFATNLPELVVLLLEELLNAPYYIELRGGIGKVERKGFYGDIYEKRKDNKYKQIAQVVENVKKLTRGFRERNLEAIKTSYASDEAMSDLLFRALSKIPSDAFEFGDLIIVNKLIRYLQQVFSLIQTTPIGMIRHTVLNVDARNRVSPTGYESDMAKRIVEVAVLKNMLMCVSGVPIIKVINEEYFGGKQVINRIPCQNFRLEKEHKYTRRYLEG